MKHYPVVLSIAGSDCSGGAGIQADIKTVSALGVYAASAITAVTVQNTKGVRAVHAVPAEIVCSQIEAVMEDMRPDAVKIGMISERIIVQVIAACLRKYNPKYVVYDPVMVSTSGKRLMEEDAIEEIKKELFPLVSLITPNLDEAEVLAGKRIDSFEIMKLTSQQLSESYGTSVLLKGGHLQGDKMLDVLYSDGNIHIYNEKRIISRNLHGTGCTLSSAIAAYLALGEPMDKAVSKAKIYLSGAIEHGKDVNIGSGNGPLCHFWESSKAVILT